jgi:hypothetical protein
MLINALKELTQFAEKGLHIEAAQIKVEQPDDHIHLSDKEYIALEETFRSIALKKGHSEEDLHTFLESLDFQYDAGFGGQNLFGTIWFTDGTWATRGEYDGSEWWEHHTRPEIPVELR